MQLAQACHGIAEFARDHADEFMAWITSSNYICVLQVPDEDSLREHSRDLFACDVPFSLVYEPDIEAFTALVIAPSEYHSRLSSLPLAGREVHMA